jgi:hypothetical protein
MILIRPGDVLLEILNPKHHLLFLENKMWRVGVLLKNGVPKAETFPTREAADEWVLTLVETEGVNLVRYKNLETGETSEEKF